MRAYAFPFHSPSTLRLLMVRPLIPFVTRNFSLYWRNKIVDWAPLEALRDIRRVVQVMDATSKSIFEEKKAIMEGRTEPEGPASLRSRMKGKDIMSIMCELNASSYAVVVMTCLSKGKHVIL